MPRRKRHWSRYESPTLARGSHCAMNALKTIKMTCEVDGKSWYTEIELAPGLLKGDFFKDQDAVMTPMTICFLESIYKQLGIQQVTLMVLATTGEKCDLCKNELNKGDTVGFYVRSKENPLTYLCSNCLGRFSVIEEVNDGDDV